jgi:hypothetical protein
MQKEIFKMEMQKLKTENNIVDYQVIINYRFFDKIKFNFRKI